MSHGKVPNCNILIMGTQRRGQIMDQMYPYLAGGQAWGLGFELPESGRFTASLDQGVRVLITSIRPSGPAP